MRSSAMLELKYYPSKSQFNQFWGAVQNPWLSLSMLFSNHVQGSHHCPQSRFWTTHSDHSTSFSTWLALSCDTALPMVHRSETKDISFPTATGDFCTLSTALYPLPCFSLSLPYELLLTLQTEFWPSLPSFLSSPDVMDSSCVILQHCSYIRKTTRGHS